MNYSTVEEVQAGFREFDEDEKVRCEALLEEAAIIIGSYNSSASFEAKSVVAARMVRRAIGDADYPVGATQGSMTAGPYSQSWTLGSSGSTGELYVSKQEKKMLKVSDKIGARSPLEAMCDD